MAPGSKCRLGVFWPRLLLQTVPVCSQRQMRLIGSIGSATRETSMMDVPQMISAVGRWRLSDLRVSAPLWIWVIPPSTAAVDAASRPADQ